MGIQGASREQRGAQVIGVDLVVVAFGESAHLAPCLQSLAKQRTGYPFAVHVATSTPNDHIRALCDAHKLTLHLKPTRGGGIGADWSFALGCGHNELVTLVHQDDLYSPSYVEEMVSIFQQWQELRFACSDHYELVGSEVRRPSSTLLVKRALMRHAFGSSPVVDGRVRRRRMLALGNPISCPSVMYRRSLLRGFSFSQTLASNLDWDAWDRLCSMGGLVGYVRQRLVHHRVHGSSATTDLIRTRVRQMEDDEMFRRFWPRPVAHLLRTAYSLSYRSNKVA